jgi:hypothetical protein
MTCAFNFKILYNSSWWSTLSLETNFYCMWVLFHIHSSLEFVYINIDVYTIVICFALLAFAYHGGFPSIILHCINTTIFYLYFFSCEGKFLKYDSNLKDLLLFSYVSLFSLGWMHFKEDQKWHMWCPQISFFIISNVNIWCFGNEN